MALTVLESNFKARRTDTGTTAYSTSDRCECEAGAHFRCSIGRLFEDSRLSTGSSSLSLPGPFGVTRQAVDILRNSKLSACLLSAQVAISAIAEYDNRSFRHESRLPQRQPILIAGSSLYPLSSLAERDRDCAFVELFLPGRLLGISRLLSSPCNGKQYAGQELRILHGC